jgi:hypothetical protein
MENRYSRVEYEGKSQKWCENDSQIGVVYRGNEVWR